MRTKEYFYLAKAIHLVVADEKEITFFPLNRKEAVDFLALDRCLYQRMVKKIEVKACPLQF